MESKLIRFKRVDDSGQRCYLSDSIGLPDIPTKDLYVFFRGEMLSYVCVQVSSLLSPSSTSSCLVVDAESSKLYKICRGGICFARWKHWLYLIGGDDSEGITGKRNEIDDNRCDVIHTSCFVMRLAILPPIHSGNVIAGYRIKSGRVLGMQSLWNILDFYFGGEILSDSIVALGNGYFCLSFTWLITDELCKLVIVTFKISRLRKESDDRFLLCEVCSWQEMRVDRDLFRGEETFSFAV